MLWVGAYGYSVNMGQYGSGGSSSFAWLMFCCFTGQLIWLWFFRRPGIDILLNNGAGSDGADKNTAFNNELHKHIYNALENKSNFVANYANYTIDNSVFNVGNDNDVQVTF